MQDSRVSTSLTEMVFSLKGLEQMHLLYESFLLMFAYCDSIHLSSNAERIHVGILSRYFFCCSHSFLVVQHWILYI